MCELVRRHEGSCRTAGDNVSGGGCGTTTRNGQLSKWGQLFFVGGGGDEENERINNPVMCTKQ